ncbi:MAG: AhpC/TSA family protein [Woeseia sp.]|nr:peroxiredoxin family protein [Woeseia sp.]MBT8095931.1 peroxiredoxin family protein [Woeseia sp.]NNE61077.1 AhpC/TSA family protein [Woeseia sp.]NNL53757.1 AhpC/TSA family protein [Woeseia sp.]
MKDAKWKSLFLVPAIILSIVLAFLSLVLALRGNGDQLAWWGAFAANLSLPLTQLYLQTAKRARVSENAPLAVLLASAGVLLAGWEWLMEGLATWLPFVVAVAGLGLLALYVFWYARFGRITGSRLDVGAKLPDFSLTDLHGELVDSSVFHGKPAILVFFRGNWCPLCMAQIAEIAELAEDFDAGGIEVAFISSQPAARSRELAERFSGSFRFLQDRDNKLARHLDIDIRNGVPAFWPGDLQPDTVMPTVVVINQNATIVYSDQTDNYRVRPDPDIFLAIIRRAGAMAR